MLPNNIRDVTCLFLVSFLFNVNLLLAEDIKLQSCKTVNGPKPNSTCVFPFEYKGHIFGTCKHDQVKGRWCSTKVDSNGQYVKGYWGNCQGFQDVLFSSKKSEENGLTSFVSIIGGPNSVAEIKKTFGFDVITGLKALLNYERKTNIQENRPNELIKKPEDKIGTVIKSFLTDLIEEDIAIRIEKHMLNLRLLKKAQPQEWMHPMFEANLSKIFQPGNVSIQTLYRLVDKMLENASKNNYLHTFLSQLNVQATKEIQEFIQLQGKEVLPDVVIYALVMESLNLEILNDWKFLETCYDVWRKDSFRQSLTGFSAIKTRSIENGVAEILKYFKTKEADNNGIFGKGISFNIFQAMAQDVIDKKFDNALAGKPLALNRPGVQNDNQTQAGPTKISENGQMIEYRPPLPSLWADLYSTWNMAYVTRFPDWPYYLVKLLIPSVSGYHDKPEEYLYPRITALYAHIINEITIKANGGPMINWKFEEISQTWGKFNRASGKDYEIQLKRANS